MSILSTLKHYAIYLTCKKRERRKSRERGLQLLRSLSCAEKKMKKITRYVALMVQSVKEDWDTGYEKETKYREEKMIEERRREERRTEDKEERREQREREKERKQSENDRGREKGEGGEGERAGARTRWKSFLQRKLCGMEEEEERRKRRRYPQRETAERKE